MNQKSQTNSAIQTHRPLAGRTALITGASTGIGRATAHALARDGAGVVLAARSEDRLHTVAAALTDEYDAETLVVPTNIRDEQQVATMVETTVEQFGSLDIVVNNAGSGAGWTDAVEDISIKDYRTMMETGIDGVFFTTRESIPYLRESQGNLIFIGSVTGHFPFPDAPLYAPIKWWTRGFAHSVEADVGTDGIAVSVINPGNTRTKWGATDGEPNDERLAEGNALEPETVADAVAFAAQQDALATVSELNIYERDTLSNV